MQLFTTGVLTVLTLLLGMRALGFVEMQGNYWIKTITFSVITTVITMIIQNYWNGFKYYSLLFLIISLFVLLRFEKNSIIKSILSIFTTLIVYIILYMILFPLTNKLFEWIGITEKLYYTTVAGILLIPITILIARLIKKGLSKNVIESISDTISDRFKKMIILAVICNIFFMLIVLNILKKFFVTSKEFILASILCFLGYSIIFSIVAFVAIYNFRKGILDSQREMQLKDVLEYNKNLEELYNDMRRFRHDYINILSSMAAYIDEGDLRGLRKYFDEKIAPISIDMDKKNSRIGFLHNIKIKEIKGILLTKTLKAQEMGIDVFIDIEEEITIINMDVIHICTGLGILLDNALEEASKHEGGYIKIGFVNKGSSLIIIISNKASFETPPIYKLFENGYSTKGNDRGIGLGNLKKIVSKYKNVFLDTSVLNGEFKQVIEVQS